MRISLDDLYDKAVALYESEDNYSNRTIVAVLLDDEENDGSYMWGIMNISDDDSDEDYIPIFWVKEKELVRDEAIEHAKKFFTESSDNA